MGYTQQRTQNKQVLRWIVDGALIKRLRTMLERRRTIRRVTLTMGWPSADAAKLDRLAHHIDQLSDRIAAHEAPAARQTHELAKLARALKAAAGAREPPTRRPRYRSWRFVTAIVFCSVLPLAAGI